MKQRCVYILASGWNGTLCVGVTEEWKRASKRELIESVNPTWRDLYPELVAR
jgi:predicted GIY-YIG superfamily endonuclease